MKKFEITSKKFYELRKQIIDKCKEYLMEVAKAWEGKQFPLSTIIKRVAKIGEDKVTWEWE